MVKHEDELLWGRSFAHELIARMERSREAYASVGPLPPASTMYIARLHVEMMTDELEGIDGE